MTAAADNPPAPPAASAPLAVLGGLGRTGRRVLALGRARGWPLRALVSDPARLATGEGIEAFAGDAADPAALRPLIAGSRAVLCCLGLRDISQPGTAFSDALRTVLAVMQATGVRRIVAIGSAAVLDHPAGGLRHEHGADPAYRHVNAEHARNLALLRAAGAFGGIDWTLLCPLMLVEEPPAAPPRLAIEALPPGGDRTTCDDVAAAMLDGLDDASSFGHRIGIVSPAGAA